MKKAAIQVGHSLQKQSGQAMVEYVLIAAALTAALFVVEFGGRTGAQHLADMIRAFFRNLTYFLSLP
jgi:Flp pilus assembly pilin Flp